MYLKRLRDLREDKDLLQKDIAEILQIKRQVYGLYEIGKRTLPIDLLNTLANYYQVSTDYILERTNQKEPIQNIDRQQNILYNKLAYSL